MCIKMLPYSICMLVWIKTRDTISMLALCIKVAYLPFLVAVHSSGLLLLLPHPPWPLHWSPPHWPHLLQHYSLHWHHQHQPNTHTHTHTHTHTCSINHTQWLYTYIVHTYIHVLGIMQSAVECLMQLYRINVHKHAVVSWTRPQLYAALDVLCH